jgi:cysteine-rich repeat protein
VSDGIVLPIHPAPGDAGEEEEPRDQEPPQACGNGIQEATEECDDGNVLPGDGCSPTCTTEVVSGPSCGNGTIELYEQCDDGNINSGDGCSPTCSIEITQVAQREAFCGDNILDTSEECEQDWHCSSNKCVACRCENNFICGNGIPEGNEECDDGNLIPGDGCSINCTVENAQTTSPTPQKPQNPPVATIIPIAQTHPPAGSTGPAALVVIVSGAAAGVGWMRKKKRL